MSSSTDDSPPQRIFADICNRELQRDRGDRIANPFVVAFEIFRDQNLAA